MKKFTRNSVVVLFIMMCTSVFSSVYADDKMPKLDCRLSDNQDSSDSKNTFSQKTDVIYLVCHSDQVKKGQKIKSVWIAADTNNVAPANYKIDENTVEVPKEVSAKEEFTGTFSLSKPDKDFPKGSYNIEIYVDNKLAHTFEFSVNAPEIADNSVSSSISSPSSAESTDSSSSVQSSSSSSAEESDNNSPDATADNSDDDSSDDTADNSHDSSDDSDDSNG